MTPPTSPAAGFEPSRPEPSRPQLAAETPHSNAAPDEVSRGHAARVFIGVKLTDEVAHELSRISLELEGPGVRLVAAGDLHLTLVAPWDEVSPSQAIARMRQAVTGCTAVMLTIQHLGYGPDPKRPRFLWADCTPSAELASLRAALLAAFGQTDDRPFRPHVTLARIRHNGRAVVQKHPIDRPMSITRLVETVELFQSPPAGERGYRVLGSGHLGNAHMAAGSQLPETSQ